MKYTLTNSEKKGIIVLIHGNSSSPEVFKDLNLDYACLKPTLYGHSVKNNKAQNSDFSSESQKKGLLELINSFDQEMMLVGNSLGGHLAIEIASEVKNLKGLMIFGTPPVKKPINIEEAFLPAPALQTFLTENPTVEDIKLAAETAVYKNNYSKIIIDDFMNTNPKVRAAIASDLFSGMWLNQFDLFTNLNCPKTIVYSDNDPSVNPVYLEKVVKKSVGKVEIYEISDCGHYHTLEKPKEMNSFINKMASEVFEQKNSK